MKREHSTNLMILDSFHASSLCTHVKQEFTQYSQTGEVDSLELRDVLSIP